MSFVFSKREMVDCCSQSVALTNLEDVENATRAYEQAVALDE